MENSDLWRELLSVRAKRGVRRDIEWTKGKKSPVTKAVDKAAKTAARQPTETDRGFRTGKVGRSRGNVAGVAAVFPATGQEVVLRIYQTGAYRRTGGENKIKFQTFSDSLRDFSAKFMAYASLDIGSLLHRGRVYRVRFNSDLKYPIVVAVLEEFPTAAEHIRVKNGDG